MVRGRRALDSIPFSKLHNFRAYGLTLTAPKNKTIEPVETLVQLKDAIFFENPFISGVISFQYPTLPHFEMLLLWLETKKCGGEMGKNRGILKPSWALVETNIMSLNIAED